VQLDEMLKNNQLVRAMNIFEVFLDFFFCRSFLIVLLLTALLTKGLPFLRLSEVTMQSAPASSSSLALHKNDITSQGQQQNHH
jgi:hypothetical protein